MTVCYNILVLKSMGEGQIDSIYIRRETLIRIQNSRFRAFEGLYTSENAEICIKMSIHIGRYVTAHAEVIHYLRIIRFPVFKL